MGQSNCGRVLSTDRGGNCTRIAARDANVRARDLLNSKIADWIRGVLCSRHVRGLGRWVTPSWFWVYLTWHWNSIKTIFTAFLDVPEVIEHMKTNYNFWKDLDNQGIHSAGQVTAYLRQMDGGLSSDIWPKSRSYPVCQRLLKHLNKWKWRNLPQFNPQLSVLISMWSGENPWNYPV